MDAQQQAWLRTHRLKHCPPGPYVTTWFPRLAQRGGLMSMREIVALHSQGANAETNCDWQERAGQFRKSHPVELQELARSGALRDLQSPGNRHSKGSAPSVAEVLARREGPPRLTPREMNAAWNVERLAREPRRVSPGGYRRRRAGG